MFDAGAVGSSFSRAAATYADAAVLQRQVEDDLLERLTLIRGAESLTTPVVVDLGAGPGRAAAQLAALDDVEQLLALDLARDMLATIPPSTGHRAQADAAFLPLRDASIDLIWSSLMLQWCPVPGRVFAEVARCLRPDGLFLFSTLGPDTLKELRSAWGSVDPAPRVSPFLDMHLLGDALLQAGFSNPVMDVRYLTLTYDKVEGLLRDLKHWGAANRRSDRPRHLTGRGRLNAMIEAYEGRRRDGRIPATFEVVYGYARGVPSGRARRESGAEVARIAIDAIGGRGKQS
ncbi:MAG: malonyl-ACP O-methyltransferase BioC [Pseudomonadota bacterium]